MMIFMATARIPIAAAADGAGLYLFVAAATLPVVSLKVASGGRGYWFRVDT
jgi:hypothetical protein